MSEFRLLCFREQNRFQSQKMKLFIMSQVDLHDRSQTQILVTLTNAAEATKKNKQIHEMIKKKLE